jgi:hypothetical protein
MWIDSLKHFVGCTWSKAPPVLYRSPSQPGLLGQSGQIDQDIVNFAVYMLLLIVHPRSIFILRCDTQQACTYRGVLAHGTQSLSDRAATCLRAERGAEEQIVLQALTYVQLISRHHPRCQANSSLKHIAWYTGR